LKDEGLELIVGIWMGDRSQISERFSQMVPVCGTRQTSVSNLDKFNTSVINFTQSCPHFLVTHVTTPLSSYPTQQALVKKAVHKYEMRRLIHLVETANRVAQVISTTQFQNWFEGSKIVDDHGNPIVCYHGTTADIRRFGDDEDIPYRGGIIAFFSTSTKFASDYALNGGNLYDGSNILPVFLNIQQPFDFRKDWREAEYFWDSTGGIFDSIEANRILMGLGHDVQIDDTDTELTEEQFVGAVKAGSWDAIEAPEFVEWLHRYHGYDGIVTLENDAVNFGIFDAAQAKSIFSFQFDPHSGDIAS
jgi:hypothetical protein